MGLQKALENKQVDRFLDELLSRFRETENRLAQLEGNEAVKYLQLKENNISNPPTDAELDAIYGTPATVGKGFTSVINDNAASANFYLIISDGSSWWYFAGTKAV